MSDNDICHIIIYSSPTTNDSLENKSNQINNTSVNKESLAPQNSPNFATTKKKNITPMSTPYMLEKLTYNTLKALLHHRRWTLSLRISRKVRRRWNLQILPKPPYPKRYQQNNIYLSIKLIIKQESTHKNTPYGPNSFTRTRCPKLIIHSFHRRTLQTFSIAT